MTQLKDKLIIIQGAFSRYKIRILAVYSVLILLIGLLSLFAFQKPLVSTLLIVTIGELVALLIYSFTCSNDTKINHKNVSQHIDSNYQTKKDRNNRHKLSLLWKKYHHIIKISIIAFLFFLIYFYMRVTELNIQTLSLNTVNYETQTDSFDFHTKGQTIVQRFVSHEDTIIALGIEFELNESVNYGKLAVSITDCSNQDILCSTIIDMADLYDYDVSHMFLDPPLDNANGKELEIRLEILESNPDNTLKIKVGRDNTTDDPNDSKRVVVAVYTEYNTFSQLYFTLIWFAVGVIVIILYILIFIKHSQIETVFVVTALSFGFLYSFVVTPYARPDEKAHIDTVYEYSNVLLGIEEPGKEKVYMRFCDTQVTFGEYPTKESYEEIYTGIFSKTGDTTLTATSSIATGVNPILYGPAVIGITVARILNLNSILLFMIGSWFNLLGFVLLVHFGMKILPFGKTLLFMIGILPITLQQASSFSYDAMINGFALLFTCYCLYIVYEKQKLKGKDILLLTILGIAVGLGKGGAYIPLIFLVLMIPMEKFSNKKSFIGVMAGIIGIALIIAIMSNASAVAETASLDGSGTGNFIEWANSPGYTIQDIFNDIKGDIQLAFNTIFDATGYYITTFLGGSLGWLNINLPIIYTYIFYILVFISALKKDTEKQYITAGNKVYMAVLSLASAALIILSMLLAFTPKYSSAVQGVQGRYFIPISLCTLLLIRNTRIVIKGSVDKILEYGAVIMQALVFLGLIRILF